jgi:glycosyltransferase involved in cell wall biosynthesis
MRIAIEGRAVAAQGGGVKTYIEQLVRHLGWGFPKDEFRIWTTKHSAIPWPSSITEEVVSLSHNVFLSQWLQYKVLPKMAAWRPEVVHFTKAAVPKKVSVPSVVTIYDVIPLLLPASQVWSRRWYWPRTLRGAAARASHIITISEASKRDIITHLEVSGDRVTVTPLAADLTHFQVHAQEECAKKVASTYGVFSPYLLYVGTIEPRKNVPLLVRAFARASGSIPHNLIIAGKMGLGHKAVMDEIGRIKSVDARVRFLDFVGYEDLPALYGGCDGFVWPSVYEGWGLPPLEAMASGAPVIVSNGGALPEVVGQSGIVVPFTTNSLDERLHDFDFEQKLSEAIVSLVSNTDTLKNMRDAARRRAELFSWEAVAERTYDVYRRVHHSRI